MVLGITLILFRIATGLFIGLTFSIIGQNFIGYNTLVFCFLLVVVLLSFIKISKNWGFILLACFNLSFVIVGYLIKLYIDVAPG